MILLGDPIQGIDHQNAHITALDRLEAAVDAEVFRAVIDAAAAADAGGVHQSPGAVLPFEAGVDGVAGGAADRAHDGALLSADRIEQTGFTDIGTPDDRQLDRLLLITLLILRRQEVEHLIQQFAGPGAVDGGDRIRLPQPEAPELRSHRQPLLGGLALVHRQQGGAGVRAQKLCDGFVGSGDALLTVDDHEGDAGLLECQVGLLPDLGQKLTVVVEHQTAGVHDLEVPVSPEPVLIGAIPRHSGFVMDDRLTAAAQTIDQRGLADVGTSDDRNDGTRHGAGLRSIPDPTDPRKRKPFETRPISLK